jgi:hypothetical protein
MSYDLMVFDVSAAPTERSEFLEWYDAQTEWEDEAGYEDPARSTPGLRAFFMELIQKYPPMNGPFSPESFPEDDSIVVDYTIGADLIYMGFAWSKAELAYNDTFALAARHGLGFFNVSSESAEVWLPISAGSLAQAHKG